MATRTIHSHRKTFCDILAETRRQSAAAAWNRAQFASQFRHMASASHQSRAAATMATVKAEAIRRAVSLLPDEILVTIDSDYQIGMCSIRWKNRGWLHLPAGELAASS